MKFVISRSFSGYGFCSSGKYWKLMQECYNERNNPKLVETVEKNPELFEGLKVVNIPDEATDYTIEEFDGFEVIFYVVDGKIYRATE